VPSCDRHATARGWCQSHYVRWWSTGDVQASAPLRRYTKGRDQRFARDVTPAEGDACWEWQGLINPAGYGLIHDAGRNVLAHRVAVELATGAPVPAGMEVDHLCRNRRCVNPEHLEVVTREENVARSDWPSAVNARKTHCIHGHEFDSQNTQITREGWRKCRTCERARCRAAHARRRSLKETAA